MQTAIETSTTTPIAPDHPDAELIALCEEHIANLAAFSADTSDLEPADNPLYVAYKGTQDAISEAEPTTLAGMVAKAWAAKVEALNPDGTEEPENYPAANWAWDLVNDLLRLHSAGLPAENAPVQAGAGS